MYPARSKDREIPHGFSTALGLIVIGWSRLETNLGVDIIAMRGHPVEGELSAKTPWRFAIRLKLWRDSIAALYPTIDQYIQRADSIFETATLLKDRRNHLIHGHWDVNGPDANGAFEVVSIDKAEFLQVTEAMLNDLVKDIRTVADAVSGFTVARMLHAHQGLLVSAPETHD